MTCFAFYEQQNKYTSFSLEFDDLYCFYFFILYFMMSLYFRVFFPFASLVFGPGLLSFK